MTTTWVVIFAVILPPLPMQALAADWYWDADATSAGNDALTGAGLGGTGTWNTTLLNWWDGVSTDGAWPNTSTSTAVFWGAAGTVTLGESLTAGGLVFNATTGSGFTLDATAAQTLSLGSGGITINSGALATTIGSANLGLSLVGNQRWTNNSTALMTVGGSVNLNGNTLSIANASTGGQTMSGVLSGSGGVAVQSTGAGTTTFSGANSYTGSTVVSSGGLTVGGAAGTIAQSSSIVINGGKLTLDNSAGIVDRIGNTVGVALSLGGELSMTGNAAADATETLGTISLTGGNGVLTVASGGAGRVTTLAGSSLQRTNFATALLRGTSLNQTAGTNVSRITLADAGASLSLVGTATLNNGAVGDATQGLKIVPYLIGDSTVSGLGGHFVTYDEALGFRVLTAAQETILNADSVTEVAPVNAIAFNGTITAPAGITVNSLLFNGTQALNGAGTGPLTVNSGAVALSTNTAASIGTGFTSLVLGNGTWNEGVVTVAQNTLTVNAPINVTGGGALVKAGAGTLVLAADSNYSGGTVINAGTLSIGTDAHLGSASSPLTANANSTLLFRTNGTVLNANRTINVNNDSLLTLSFGNFSTGITIAGKITGSGGIHVNNTSSSRTMFLTNPDNDFEGRLRIGFTTNTVAAQVAGLADSAAADGNIQLGGTSGVGVFSWSTLATTPLVLNHRQIEITGTLNSGGGTLSSSNASASNTITVNTDLLVTATPGVTKTLTLQGANLGDNTFAGRISNGTVNGLNVTKAEAGKWILSGANTYTGTTSLTLGTLQVGGAENFGVSGPLGVGGSILFGGGTLQYSAANAFDYSNRFSPTAQTIRIDTNGRDVTFGSAMMSGVAGSLVKVGTGTLTLNAANSFTGSTTVTAGTLAIGGAGSLGTATTLLTLNGGQLNLGSSNAEIAGPVNISLPAASGNTLEGGTISATSFNVSNAAGTVGISSSLGGAAAILNKTGAGTLQLSAANTYGGGTSVAGGVLSISNDNQLGAVAGAVSMAAGTTLQVTDSMTWNAARTLSFAGAATIDVADAGETLTFANAVGPLNVSLTKTGLGTLAYTGGINNSTSADLIANAGTLRIASNVSNPGTAGYLYIANAAASSAAVVQSSGTTVLGSLDATDGGLTIARGANSFGSYTILGGSLTTSRLDVGNKAGTVGIANLLGGNVNVNAGFIIGGRTPTSTGVINLDGGNLTGSFATTGRVGVYGGGRLEVSVRNGAFDLGSNLTNSAYNFVANTGGTSILNLLPGGVLKATAISSSVAPGTGNFNQLNFNGGTLQYSGTVAQPTFSAQPANYSVFLHSLGGTFDDGGQIVTTASPFLAPTGDGVTSIAIVDGGSGYLAAPYVRITGGGGSGATAVATIDANGTVTGITITNPGTGYTGTPTVTLVGGTNGGATSQATLGAVATAANVSGGLTKIGSGALVIAGAGSNYAGLTAVQNGVLRAGVANAFSPNSIVELGTATTDGVLDVAGFATTVGGLRIAGGAAAANQLVGNSSTATNAVLTVNTAVGDSTFGGVIRDTLGAGNKTLGLTVIGSGTLTLSGANTYSGGTSVNGGVLALSGGGTLGSNLAPLTLGGGRLNLGGGSVTVGALSITAAAASGDTLTNGTLSAASIAVSNASGNAVLSAGLAGATAGLTKTGLGAATLSAANTYGGGTSINGGPLILSGLGTLGSTSAALSLGGGSLDLGGTAQTVGAVTISAAPVAGDVLSNGTLTGTSFAISNATGQTIISASLAGPSATLTKTGAGSTTLSAANSYGGATNVNAGTLALSGAGSLGSSSAALNLGGGHLDLGGTTRTVGAVNITAAPATGDTLSNGTLNIASFTSSNRPARRSSAPTSPEAASASLRTAAAFFV